MRGWLDQFWDQALTAFQAEVERTAKQERESRMTTRTITIAPVRKSIRVKASQAHAFEVFTSGLGRWWPHKGSIGARR